MTAGNAGAVSADVWGHVPDLMDRSRIDAAGIDVHWARDATELIGCGARLVVVDLSREGVLDVVIRITGTVRVVGFAAHVDDVLIEAGVAAGCDEVLARSVFFRRVREILQQR